MIISDADYKLLTETLEKTNQWVAEAKPLLERGGKAEDALKRIRDEIHNTTSPNAIVQGVVNILDEWDESQNDKLRDGDQRL